MGGTSLYTLSFGAASLYPSNFAVAAYNADSGRGKVVAASGRSSFILWPLQTTVIYNDANVWKLSPNTQPWVVPAGTVFNVDNVNGSDSVTNDGLGAQGTNGAFATVQNALNIIQKNMAQFGAGVNIQLPTTTSTPIVEQVTTSGFMPEGIATLTIIGNTTTPTLCQWQIANGQIAVTLDDYQSITVNGIGFSCTGAGTFLSCSKYCEFDVTNCNFGTNAGGTDISVNKLGTVNLLSGNSISGSCGQFLQMVTGANANVGTAFSISGSPNVGTFLNVNQGAICGAAGTSFTGAGTISGQTFLVRDGGVLIGDSGVSWPVSMSTGTASSGGMADAFSTTYSGVQVTSPLHGGIGYATGAGGTVVQATSKATAVTLATSCGQITMSSATLAASTVVSFSLTNSVIAATDVLVLNHISGGTPGSYGLNAQAAAGSATINVRNNTAGALAEAIVLQYALVKAVNS